MTFPTFMFISFGCVVKKCGSMSICVGFNGLLLVGTPIVTFQMIGNWFDIELAFHTLLIPEVPSGTQTS